MYNCGLELITVFYIIVENGAGQKKPLEELIAVDILNYNISYPTCSYSETSRRINNLKSSSLLDKLKLVDGWNNFDVIAIDGQNGTTKSTLCKKLMRTYRKINELAPEITCGSNYNFEPLRSMEYMCMQLAIESHDSVWDRCSYSNLIFYYVHHLMYEFKDKPIPYDTSIVWPVFNMLAINTNLTNTLDYCKRIRNIPTIFFVCSDIDYISESLRLRGIKTKSVNDLWNSKEFNYQMAQYHAYVWFGKILGYPVFDLTDFFQEGYNIDDMHTIIASKIDRRPETDVCILPDRTYAKLLNDLLIPLNDDILVYDYSKK